MTDREAYFIWAPPESPWSDWAKPALFASIDPQAPAARPPDPLSERHARWIRSLGRRVAIVADLPGVSGIDFGLQLAAEGYRPVPLFNTSVGNNPVVPVRDLVERLGTGAERLRARSVPVDAAPVFLLDSQRQRSAGTPVPGQYDNRWIVFPQDFPSARKLKEHGIETVLLWQEDRTTPSEDLAHVLLRWQQEGLAILAVAAKGEDAPQRITVTKPARFRGLFYRLVALAGLRRNSAGGFGAIIPQPSSGHG